jgi:PTH1 family peptidyl-tRNA hydrolase
MNLSGLAVKDVVDHYQDTPVHLVVIYDDLDLELGRLRIRKKGGHGGHKGVKSIIEHLDTNEFVRLKIGIGHPLVDAPKPESSERESVVDYVLQPFQSPEQDTVQSAINRAAEAVECIVSGHIDQAMNVYNRNVE